MRVTVPLPNVSPVKGHTVLPTDLYPYLQQGVGQAGVRAFGFNMRDGKGQGNETGPEFGYRYAAVMHPMLHVHTGVEEHVLGANHQAVCAIEGQLDVPWPRYEGQNEVHEGSTNYGDGEFTPIEDRIEHAQLRILYPHAGIIREQQGRAAKGSTCLVHAVLERACIQACQRARFKVWLAKFFPETPQKTSQLRFRGRCHLLRAIFRLALRALQIARRM